MYECAYVRIDILTIYKPNNVNHLVNLIFLYIFSRQDGSLILCPFTINK